MDSGQRGRRPSRGDPLEYSFTRYLTAKVSVDDRALNHHVWQTLVERLPVASPEAPLRIVEVGAGIGTMIERALERGLLSYAAYTAVDVLRENLEAFRRRLPHWAEARRLACIEEGEGGLIIRGEGLGVEVRLVADDAFDFAARRRGRETWDLLIAHAFLDLVDLSTALPALLALLRPGGLCYFTLNFDGVTTLMPEIDPAFDALVERLYHRTMDERLVDGKPSGDSRTGRKLLDRLHAMGVERLAVGSSDWVVFPRQAEYPADEAYFLHFIIHTLETALRGHPELDGDRFAEWVAERRAQIERRELVYIAHQLDLLGHLRDA